MRVYLDTSIYNRPFDDQNQVKIFLETQATISILRLINEKSLELVVSSVLEQENQRNSSLIRQQFTALYLNKATLYQFIDSSIIERGEQLKNQGLKTFDALHVACAEAANCDYLITCDRRLINACKSLAINVINPVNFILETEDENLK